jgi:hypothetical protein
VVPIVVPDTVVTVTSSPVAVPGPRSSTPPVTIPVAGETARVTAPAVTAAVSAPW